MTGFLVQKDRDVVGVENLRVNGFAVGRMRVEVR